MIDLFEDPAIAACIGCGCTDDQACAGGCGWMRLDRSIGRGVCTQCVDHVAAWDEASVLADETWTQACTKATGRPFAYRPVQARQRWLLLPRAWSRGKVQSLLLAA